MHAPQHGPGPRRRRSARERNRRSTVCVQCRAPAYAYDLQCVKRLARARVRELDPEAERARGEARAVPRANVAPTEIRARSRTIRTSAATQRTGHWSAQRRVSEPRDARPPTWISNRRSVRRRRNAVVPVATAATRQSPPTTAANRSTALWRVFPCFRSQPYWLLRYGFPWWICAAPRCHCRIPSSTFKARSSGNDAFERPSQKTETAEAVTPLRPAPSPYLAEWPALWILHRTGAVCQSSSEEEPAAKSCRRSRRANRRRAFTSLGLLSTHYRSPEARRKPKPRIRSQRRLRARIRGRRERGRRVER